jgi:hypothetical protein
MVGGRTIVVAEEKCSGVLQQLVDAGEATPPTERGLPDLRPDLAHQLASLSDLLIEDRDNERRT